MDQIQVQSWFVHEYWTFFIEVVFWEVNFTMLCNCLWIDWTRFKVQSCFVHGNKHHLGSVSSIQWISPCSATIYEFHHVVQLFVNFTILCYCGHEVLLRSCFCVVGMLYGLLGCVILFVNFTILCYCLWIDWTRFKFNPVLSMEINIIMNFTMLCNCLWISPYCAIVVMRCSSGLVFV